MFLEKEPFNGISLFSEIIFEKEIISERSKKNTHQGFLGDFVTRVFAAYDLIVEDSRSF